MIDSWFKKDLEAILDQHPVAVFIDESGDAEFLLSTIEKIYDIHRTNGEMDELRVKYDIERAKSSGRKHLIYTKFKRDDLRFIREYCEIHGCLELGSLQNYVKNKVHQTLNLNINLPKDELIAASKVSIGKDKNYWLDISHKGSSEIFDLNKELLPFLNNPEAFESSKYDKQLRGSFYRKVGEMVGMDFTDKPVQTIAGEVVKVMLDGLITNDLDSTLESVYKSWLDSLSYRESFMGYLDAYEISESIDYWKVHPQHPFSAIDELWLAELGTDLTQKSTDKELIKLLQTRSLSSQARAIGVTFWDDVLVLLTFDPKEISYLSSMKECIEYYQKHFYKLDTSIRNLYTDFLNKRHLLEPFQELYKNFVIVFMDKWFSYWNSYKENQSGVLQRIIDENQGKKISVIVGDGVAYEMAVQVSLKMKASCEFKKDIILADIPSETENNMSRIYMDNGIVEAVQAKREKYLASQNPDLSIDFIRLDEVGSEPLAGDLLICTYKDIDDMGEKLQQKALKYFPETIDFFAEKIAQLLKNGYAKVYMITDHGFVLTGLLSESDKITVDPVDDFDKAERYLRTESKQNFDNLIGVERKYKNFNYLYFSKGMNPFKTPGLYGFSHGGLAPQELITPYFCWEQNGVTALMLKVSFTNKEDLAAVSGGLFVLKISAGSQDNIYKQERKVQIVFFDGKDKVNSSDIFTIRPDESINKEFAFDGHTGLEAQLLDAETKQLLDRAIIKQNNDRDLGGLL
jgi:putative component of toxin-antitoxin plasmid stabilization module